MYPQPQDDALQLLDFLLEARKSIIEEYPILNWQSNVLKGAIGDVKGGLTKMGEGYGSFMYDLNIPFVSDMVGECYGVRGKEVESSAGSIVGAFMKGVVVDGLGGTVEGIANLVADPYEAIGGVTKILTYPEETLPQIWDGVKEYWNKKVVNGTAEDRANVTGQAVFEIASWFVGAGEAKAAVSGAKVVDKTFDTARLLEKIGDTGNGFSKVGKKLAGGLDNVINKGIKGTGDAIDKLRNTINGMIGQQVEFSGIGSLDDMGKTAESILDKYNNIKKSITDKMIKFESSGVKISGDKAGGIGAERNGQTIKDLGELIGEGGNKQVYAYGEDKVVAIMKDGKPIDAIDDELSMLKQLDELDLPTVNAEKILIDGKPSILMDKCAQESKSIAAFDKAKGKVTLKQNADTSLLNQNSINDLNLIKNKMVTEKIKIDDLQFLIKDNGHIVIADPLKVIVGQAPSKNNIKMIDILIEAAKKNQ